IDSDVKIAELYKEIRKEGTQDEKHCMLIKQIPDLGWEAPVTNKATSTGDSDSQSTKSPLPTKTTKSPPLEPMPQRKTPPRRSERIKKKMDTINEIIEEEVEVLETSPQGNEKLNILKLAATTCIVIACTVAVKTLEMQVFQV
ncbi:MAG: hypothetical protein MJE68_11100, partial [Proteobacteria bacterium]|nr:hypothetical protein [Pseudomonadota bacterium]